MINTNFEVRQFRTSKALLESGFPTSSFINSTEDFKGLYTHQNTNEIKSFSIRADDMDLFKDDIIIKEYKIIQSL
ncbi:MAG: hypothetical protein QM710_09170 [Flavobacterium sp.]